MTAQIRIRSTLRLQWQWELITADGHIASASHPFPTREACEADAKRQGLPVKGLNNRAKVPRVHSPTGSSKWRFPCTPSGLWQWRRWDGTGKLMEESARAFLTRDECVEDAVKHGYLKRDTIVPGTKHRRPVLDDTPPAR